MVLGGFGSWKSVVKMSARPSSEGVTGAGMTSFQDAAGRRPGFHPRGSRLLICLETREPASSRISDPRKSKVEPLW